MKMVCFRIKSAKKFSRSALPCLTTNAFIAIPVPEVAYDELLIYDKVESLCREEAAEMCLCALSLASGLQTCRIAKDEKT
jgi:hypothetical protein